MRTFAQSFAIAMTVGAVVSASGRQREASYDAVMAMPVAQRQAALSAMEPDARFALYRTHLERWLETNHHRLSAEKVALVREVHDLLTPAQNASRRLVER